MEQPELEKKLGELSYMNASEQEDYLLLYGPRKQRKAIKASRKAKQAQESGSERKG